MQHVLDAIQSDATSADFANLTVPSHYRAVHVRKDEQDMWKDVPSKEKDPRRSLHVGEVPTPEIAPDEVYVAVMASSINFNTVWSSIFEPVSTFGPMARLGRESEWAKRHDRDYQVVGSDASGVVLKVGTAVRNWKPGDRVTVHCNHVDDQDQSAHDDSMGGRQPADLGLRDQLRWARRSRRGEGQPTDAQARSPHVGGGGGECVVQQHELSHARRPQRCADGAGRRRADLGRHRRHRRLRHPVRVERWRHPGVRRVVPRQGRHPAVDGCRAHHRFAAAGYQFWKDERTHDESEWRRLGKDIRDLCGEDPDIVFEHPGRSTFAASMYVAKRGGTVVTCAATSGFMLEFDNRHF